MSVSDHSCLHWALRDMDGPPRGSEGDYDVCAICHESLASCGPTVAYPCAHRFHRHCLVQWFCTSTSHVKCPMCMQDCGVLSLCHDILRGYQMEIASLQRRLDEQTVDVALGREVTLLENDASSVASTLDYTPTDQTNTLNSDGPHSPPDILRVLIPPRNLQAEFEREVLYDAMVSNS